MKVVAHRGFSARFPENSYASFDAAVESGADWIETDVRVTADGVLVCAHDPDLTRIAGVGMRIADCTAAGLAGVRLPGGGRILALPEVLARLSGRAPVMLDVKIDDVGARRAIAECVAAAAMTQRVIYGVRSAEHARALLAQGAGLDLLAMPPEPSLLDEFPVEGLVGVRLWEDQLSAAALARIRARGAAVWVTAGLRGHGEAPGFITAGRLKALVALGVDAVLVNDVELGRRTIDANG